VEAILFTQKRKDALLVVTATPLKLGSIIGTKKILNNFSSFNLAKK